MKNVRRTAYGFQLYTRVRGRFVSEHWTGKTEPLAMDVREWVRQQHVAIKAGIELPNQGSTFRDDVAIYLQTRASMPTVKWREADLALWVQIYGDRSRDSISAIEVRQHLEHWKAHGPKLVYDRKAQRFTAVKGPLAANTVNHRRTALLSFFTVMEGKSGRNPVRDVPRYRDDSLDRPPRALPDDLVTAAFAAMPATKSRARCRVLRWTGWPHSTIARVTPEDLHLKQRTAWIGPRKKGRGVRGRTLPLLPQAVAALREFDRLDAYGSFSTSSLRKAWLLALEIVRQRVKAKQLTLSKAGRAALAESSTPYDLRHTFGAMLSRGTTDRKARQLLMLHGDPRQTDRYESAAVQEALTAAVREVRRAL